MSMGDGPAIDSATTTPPARNVATEMVGTALLMLGGPGFIVLTDGNAGLLTYAVAFGLAAMLSIGVIGALANPALSLAMMIVREITPREAAADVIGQVLGGLVGGLMIWGLNDQTRAVLGATGWDRNGFAELGTGLAAELVFTVVLVVVLLAAISQGFSQLGIAAAAGAAYTLGMLVLLDLTGGGMNPARAIGSAVFSDTDPNALGQVWMFVVIPLVAAVAGVFIWLLVDDATVDDTLFDETILDDLADAVDGTPD